VVRVLQDQERPKRKKGCEVVGGGRETLVSWLLTDYPHQTDLSTWRRNEWSGVHAYLLLLRSLRLVALEAEGRPFGFLLLLLLLEKEKALLF
jgi:hypothetical protein